MLVATDPPSMTEPYGQTLADWVDDYLCTAVGVVIDELTVQTQAVDVYRLYAAHAQHDLSDGLAVDMDSMVSQSEWAQIMPLFRLYVERANAIALESAHIYGVELYGRSSSEIANDIAVKEDELKGLAFDFDIVTV